MASDTIGKELRALERNVFCASSLAVVTFCSELHSWSAFSLDRLIAVPVVEFGGRGVGH